MRSKNCRQLRKATRQIHMKRVEQHLIEHEVRNERYRMLQSLDVTKSMVDDGMTPRILNSCVQSLCCPLTTLFHMMTTCQHTVSLSQLLGKSAVLLLYLRRVQELIQHVTSPSQFC